MPTRRTNAELLSENARLTTEVAALRRFVFEIDLTRENSNLEAQRSGAREILAGTPGARAVHCP
jgi:hypothetical protein